jgi:hypothetical protein
MDWQLFWCFLDWSILNWCFLDGGLLDWCFLDWCFLNWCLFLDGGLLLNWCLWIEVITSIVSNWSETVICSQILIRSLIVGALPWSTTSAIEAIVESEWSINWCLLLVCVFCGCVLLSLFAVESTESAIA